MTDLISSFQFSLEQLFTIWYGPYQITAWKHGSIENLQPVNVIGFVNANEGFGDHAKVLNGFTDKLSEYFSEKSTRSAVGVASLPLNVCVEVQCVFIYG